jgi:hypothetical protein
MDYVCGGEAAWVKRINTNHLCWKHLCAILQLKFLEVFEFIFHIKACYHRLILCTTTDNLVMYRSMAFGKTVMNPLPSASHSLACKNPYRAVVFSPFSPEPHFYKSLNS